MKISFDPRKDEANIVKHGLSLTQAERMDWNAVVDKIDSRKDYGELREIGYGLIDGRLYCVVFVRKIDELRIISFRKANRREVKFYVNQTHHHHADG